MLLLTQTATAEITPDILNQARMLLDGGKAIEAYHLLSPHESAEAGNRDFDYLLGLSALDSGEVSRAVFVFERLIQVSPGFGGARMELARAYFQLGELHQAKYHFDKLLSLSPPDHIRRVIEQYLQSIEQQLSAQHPQWNLNAELAAGHDTNANSATDAQTFFGFILSEQSKRLGSDFSSLQSAVSYRYPFLDGWQIDAQAGVMHRDYVDAPFVNTTMGDVSMRTGLNRPWGSVSLTVNGSSTDVDQSFNNQVLAVTLDASESISKVQRLNQSVRYGQLRFPTKSAIRDLDSQVYVLGWSMQVQAVYRPIMMVSFSYGVDTPVLENSFYGKEFGGARIGVIAGSSGPLGFYLTTGLTEFTYDTPFFGMSRTERQTITSVGAIWKPIKSWSIKPAVNYTNNETDIELFKYNRLTAQIGVRFDLR